MSYPDSIPSWTHADPGTSLWAIASALRRDASISIRVHRQSATGRRACQHLSLAAHVHVRGDETQSKNIGSLKRRMIDGHMAPPADRADRFDTINDCGRRIQGLLRQQYDRATPAGAINRCADDRASDFASMTGRPPDAGLHTHANTMTHWSPIEH